MYRVALRRLYRPTDVGPPRDSDWVKAMTIVVYAQSEREAHNKARELSIPASEGHTLYLATAEISEIL